LSNGTIHSAADITTAIDEIIEYLKTGDENWHALMHANLLLTNLMRLLRPIAKPARQPDLSHFSKRKLDQCLNYSARQSCTGSIGASGLGNRRLDLAERSGTDVVHRRTEVRVVEDIEEGGAYE
jgi:hypothetical protein